MVISGVRNIVSPIVATACVGVAAAQFGCSQEAPQSSGSGKNTKNPQIAGAAPSGEALFKQYCSSCHPNGGNVSDPERSLYASVLKRKHISAPDDIVRIMRHPISRMIRFDTATLSDKEAQAIAEYVLTEFR